MAEHSVCNENRQDRNVRWADQTEDSILREYGIQSFELSPNSVQNMCTDISSYSQQKAIQLGNQEPMIQSKNRNYSLRDKRSLHLPFRFSDFETAKTAVFTDNNNNNNNKQFIIPF